VSELIDACRNLKRCGLSVRLWVAGASDDGNPAAIPQEVLKTWQQEGVAEFLGQRSDIPDLLQHVSIAVLPTNYNEGVPRFLLEAAAVGLPLIATDIEGCRLVVREDENGFIIPAGDVRALSDAIARLVMDCGLRERMGQASRKIAIEQFDEKLILAKYLGIYRKLGLLPGNTSGICGGYVGKDVVR